MFDSSFVLKQAISYHADFFTPEASKQELLIALHGNLQTKEIAMKYAKRIRSDWSLAALQGPYSGLHFSSGKAELGFGWVSDFNSAEAIANHHSFISAVIDEAFTRGLIHERKAFLFGFSQSVSLNYRFSKAQPDLVKGIIAVAGAAPTDWPAQKSESMLDVPVLHIAMTEDKAYPIERSRKFKEKLTNHYSHLTWHEEAGGHRVPKAAYSVMKEWLFKQTQGSLA